MKKGEYLKGGGEGAYSRVAKLVVLIFIIFQHKVAIMFRFSVKVFLRFNILRDYKVNVFMSAYPRYVSNNFQTFSHAVLRFGIPKFQNW